MSCVVRSYSYLRLTASANVTSQSQCGPKYIANHFDHRLSFLSINQTETLSSFSFLPLFVSFGSVWFWKMAVEFMMDYRNNNFSAKMEENAVQEAASGLESVEKLIRLLSQTQQQQQQQQQQYQIQSQSQSQSQNQSSSEMERDCKAVADVAVSKFKKVISLLGRTRTGHARFRRGPLAPPPPPTHLGSNPSQERSAPEPRVYHATPIQQIPPLPQFHGESFMPKNGVMERKDSSTTTINFSYSSAATSFMSSLTGDTDSKQQPSSSSAFQITNLSQVSSVGKPPLSTASLKRKCSSENLGSGKCGGSSGRCHCSKKRSVTWSISSVSLSLTLWSFISGLILTFFFSLHFLLV